jgi:putative hydrolase of HD superfamily
MAPLHGPQIPDYEQHRLIRKSHIHHLGEPNAGDNPAPEQARRRAAGETEGTTAAESRDLETLVAPLPTGLRDDLIALWDEYEAAVTPTARVAKALDKLETILQHTQGDNPPSFDYRFNLDYGRQHTNEPPLIATLRKLLDQATEDRAVASGNLNRA